jgi:hypothetical protein
MLAEPGRRKTPRPTRDRETRHDIVNGQGAEFAILDLYNDDALAEMRIRYGIGNGVDRPGRHARYGISVRVLVDEYQDTNRLQASILLALNPTDKGLTVVGDDAQSIYSFRAATLGNILALAKIGPAVESRRILDLLFEHVIQPQWTCRFRWTAHSIAFWDNRCAQHYAISDYWPTAVTRTSFFPCWPITC